MAPSPENDSAPKAPDKGDKSTDQPQQHQCSSNKDKEPENALNELNDRELQDLLEEAVNYKNPTDREGKSTLFNYLLNEAEQEERNSRASRAGGSERVRYHNPSAKRNSKHRKKQNSVSENVMHGGSLDNLNKEELYEHSKKIAKKSVSARQKEGGSLPSNVNAGAHLDIKYFQEEKEKMEVMTRVNDMEAQRLLDHDVLAETVKQNQEQPYVELFHPVKFTSRATLQVNNVDDPMHISSLEGAMERNKISDGTKFLGNKCIYVPNCKLLDDVKKVDENGNAVQQQQLQNSAVKAKKKKSQTEKNVVVCTSENVEGHRGDIIDDVNKLMEYIGVANDKTNRSLKSKQLNRHTSEDKNSGKKQRAHSSKSKHDCSQLKKSNSLGEISTASLEDFTFNKEKIVMRNKIVDKPRERRSWGNVEPPDFDTLYSNLSGESLETAEFRVVTKKKSKKRGKQSSTLSGKGMRVPSPDLRRKSASSVPHSEKSNDSSSDVDSVHSLPIDSHHQRGMTHNVPISYADIARNSDAKTRDKKSPNPSCSSSSSASNSVGSSTSSGGATVEPEIVVITSQPLDFNNFKNFPAITTPNKQQPNVVVMTALTTKSSNKNSRNVKSDIESYTLPHDIPDVQTIEKLQMIDQGHHGYNTTNNLVHNNNVDNFECTDYCDRTNNNFDVIVMYDDEVSSNNNNMSNNKPPPVVILSGNRDVVTPGLVFGFDINEQLLHDDDVDSTQDFLDRYVPPEVFTPTSHNHDKIVTYIGSAWEEVLFQSSLSSSSSSSGGKVRYYSDLL